MSHLRCPGRSLSVTALTTKKTWLLLLLLLNSIAALFLQLIELPSLRHLHPQFLCLISCDFLRTLGELFD